MRRGFFFTAGGEQQVLAPQQVGVAASAGVVQHAGAGGGAAATSDGDHRETSKPAAAAIRKNAAGGRMPVSLAQATRSAGVWQQHAFQQRSAVAQPQAHASQGKRSVDGGLSAGSVGSGRPLAAINRLAATSAAIAR